VGGTERKQLAYVSRVNIRAVVAETISEPPNVWPSGSAAVTVLSEVRRASWLPDDFGPGLTAPLTSAGYTPVKTTLFCVEIFDKLESIYQITFTTITFNRLLAALLTGSLRKKVVQVATTATIDKWQTLGGGRVVVPAWEVRQTWTLYRWQDADVFAPAHVFTLRLAQKAVSIALTPAINEKLALACCGVVPPSGETTPTRSGYNRQLTNINWCPNSIKDYFNWLFIDSRSRFNCFYRYVNLSGYRCLTLDRCRCFNLCWCFHSFLSQTARQDD